MNWPKDRLPQPTLQHASSEIPMPRFGCSAHCASIGLAPADANRRFSATDPLVVRSRRANERRVDLALQEPAAEGGRIGLAPRQ
jgi:hypothetical protein